MAVFVIMVTAGCASGPVTLEDKDGTGRYDGVWLADVAGPRAKQAELPGNWYASCDWAPYILTFTVSDGMIKRAGAKKRTPVSTDGKFKLITVLERTGIDNVNFVYSGTLGDTEGKGRFEEVHTGYGATGCSANVSFARP